MLAEDFIHILETFEKWNISKWSIYLFEVPIMSVSLKLSQTKCINLITDQIN